MNSLSAISTLVRYWMKGRITRAIAVWMIVGECFGLLIVLFVGGTFLSFSSKFDLGGGVSDASLSLLFDLPRRGRSRAGSTGAGSLSPRPTSTMSSHLPSGRARSSLRRC